MTPDAWVPVGCVRWHFGVAEPHQGELWLELADGSERTATDAELTGLLLERPRLREFVTPDRLRRLDAAEH